MEHVLLFIEENETWILLFLLFVGLIYLRGSIRWLQEARGSMFGLERASALRKLSRSGAMLALVLMAAIAVFVVSTFLYPAIPVAGPPTPIPTVSHLPALAGEAGGDISGAGGGDLPAGTVTGDGCLNLQAVIDSPEGGETVSGIVEVYGTGDIPGFAFYKLEYRLMRPDAVWRAISADTLPKQNDLLGSWDTSLVDPGEYYFRLVVTDTTGNGPFPCVIELRVVPSS